MVNIREYYVQLRLKNFRGSSVNITLHSKFEWYFYLSSTK